MARRRTISPRDEYGNSFVTYTEITPEAVLAQPDLRTTKQSVQTQRIAENNGGSSALSNNSIGPSSSVSSISVPSLSMDQDADNVNSPTSEGDNAAKSAQSLNTFANVMSVASAFNPIAGIPGAIARGVSASKQASRQGKTLAQYTVDEAKNALGIKGASRQAFDAMQTAQINAEPEAGYRSTGNPRGSRSGVSDINTGKIGRNESFYDGPTTRGPSPSMDTNSDMGFGGDGDTGPGSGPPGSEGQGNI
jgi:hypothetical protein|tara:strand:+ start:2460 stop:3206 length:747 start_codon:yes stop_codon:yes gene_type:complete